MSKTQFQKDKQRTDLEAAWDKAVRECGCEPSRSSSRPSGTVRAAAAWQGRKVERAGREAGMAKGDFKRICFESDLEALEIVQGVARELRGEEG